MKKVDVHALKTGLWKEMQGITQGGKVCFSCILFVFMY